MGPCANRVWRSQKGPGSERPGPERVGPTVVWAGCGHSAVEGPQVTAEAAWAASGDTGAEGGEGRQSAERMMALAHSGLVARESGADRPGWAGARFPGPGVGGRAEGGGWWALRGEWGAAGPARRAVAAAGESGSGGFREARRESALLRGKEAGAEVGYLGPLGQAGRCSRAVSCRAHRPVAVLGLLAGVRRPL